MPREDGDLSLGSAVGDTREAVALRQNQTDTTRCTQGTAVEPVFGGFSARQQQPCDMKSVIRTADE